MPVEVPQEGVGDKLIPEKFPQDLRREERLLLYRIQDGGELCPITVQLTVDTGILEFCEFDQLLSAFGEIPQATTSFSLFLLSV